MTTIPTRTLLPRPGRQYDQRSERQRNELVERRLRQIMARFDTLETQVATFDARITQNESDIVDLQNEKADKQWVADNFAIAVYGGLSLSTPQTGPDLGGGWVTLPVDQNIVAVPRGITTDPVAGTVSFLAEGVYTLVVSFAISHNSSNQGRTSNIRTYNVTDATPGTALPWATGRNAEGSELTLVVLTEIGAAQVGDAIRVEVGGGDSYTSVDWNAAQISVLPAGEFKGTLP